MGAVYEPLDLKKELEQLEFSLAMIAQHLEEAMRRYQRLKELLEKE
jgi:hypothetical protein